MIRLPRRKTEDSHPTPAGGAHCFRNRLDPRSIRLPRGGEQWSRTTHANVPSVFKTVPSPARIALRRRKWEDSNLTHDARIAFQASSVPDGFPFHWSGQRDSWPSRRSRRAPSSGVAARTTHNLSDPNRVLLSRLSYTQVVARGEYHAHGGPSANRTQCELLIRELRVTNPSWPIAEDRGAVRTEGFEPSLPRV